MNLNRFAPEVRQFYCNLTAAGGSISTNTLGALSAFVNRLKAHATLWDKLDGRPPTSR